MQFLYVLEDNGATWNGDVALNLAVLIEQYIKINKIKFNNFDKLIIEFNKNDGPMLNPELWKPSDCDICCLLYFLAQLNLNHTNEELRIAGLFFSLEMFSLQEVKTYCDFFIKLLD